MATSLRLGTRGSRLALAQAESAKLWLEGQSSDLAVEVVPIKTSGDLGKRERLGAFVREIQEALLRGEVDIALHCLKDLPTEPIPGLEFSAYCEREDARDTLISRVAGLSALAPGSVVGTGSVRRTSQIASVRPDLEFRPLVGNIDTRLRKLIGGEYDAIVLAQAGLTRLGIMDSWESSEFGALVVRPFTFEEILPAPGQAVLVFETRVGDVAARSAAAPLDHAPTRACAEAERAFLREFGGGCSVPVAALAIANGNSLTLTGLVSSPDGKTVLRDMESGATKDGVPIARTLAARLGERGAFHLFQGRVPESVELNV